MTPSVILNFQILEIFAFARVRMADLHHCHFLEIGQTVEEITHFSSFRNDRRSFLKRSSASIFKFCRSGDEPGSTSSCQVLSKSRLNGCGNMAISRFSKWGASAILDLLEVYLDHPRWVVVGLRRFAKFGWKRCSSFDNSMQVSVIVNRGGRPSCFWRLTPSLSADRNRWCRLAADWHLRPMRRML